MASKPKLSVVASAIQQAVNNAEAISIAQALIEFVAAEDAIERINHALAEAKKAAIPWGDARKPS